MREHGYNGKKVNPIKEFIEENVLLMIALMLTTLAWFMEGVLGRRID